jgi:peptidyl-prolyl cis-trans isomerase SurA
MTASYRVVVSLLVALFSAAPAVAAIHTVRNTDDSGDGSLRKALKDASDGDAISFASDVEGEIALESSLDVDSDVAIKGPGANVVTVRGKEGVTVASAGTVSISGLTIAGGDTAIELKHGKLTLLDSAVVDSTGDGIANQGGRLTLLRSLVARNRGIGIANASGSTTCVNSTIADNSGAGIVAHEGDVMLASCTIAGNGGTGIETASGQAVVHNTLIAGNVQGCSGRVSSKGYNLTDDARCGFEQSGDQTSDDPRLGALSGNGGPTQTKALTGGSAAIDGGDPNGCADPTTSGLLSTDQRGARRPAGARCDIGAFEAQAAVAGTVVGRILALVDGDPVTLYELKDFAAGDPRLKQALLTDEAAVLDLLITKRLIQKEVEKQGIVVQDADVDRYIANIRERNKIDDAQLDAALAQQGLTRERYRAQVREELQRAQLINREIRGKVSVSPEEVARYYKEHDSEGGGGGNAEVTISQIFLKLPADASPDEVKEVEARADAIYKELKGGADFAEVAKKDSEDGAASSGGKLGAFKSGEMREDLEQAIKGLDPGEFSKPVRGTSGIHIVRVDERVGPGTKNMPDEKADEIKEQLYAKALEDRYNRWLKEDLRQRHHVEIRP